VPKHAVLKRSIHRGDKGPDVLALKRTLVKAKFGYLIVTQGPGAQTFGPGVEKAMKKFQKQHGLLVDGVLGLKTFRKLIPYMDAYSISLFASATTKTPAEETFARLLSIMKAMTQQTPGYVWGGGHGQRLSEVHYWQGLDCSSSCSKALFDAGIFPDSYAWVSGKFETYYGARGTGKMFTVYANYEHVWIRLYKTPYWRFDTSPHGDGGRGPKLRRLPRFTFRFTPRHREGF
jgi:hypothetical protein